MRSIHRRSLLRLRLPFGNGGESSPARHDSGARVAGRTLPTVSSSPISNPSSLQERCQRCVPQMAQRFPPSCRPELAREQANKGTGTDSATVVKGRATRDLRQRCQGARSNRPVFRSDQAVGRMHRRQTSAPLDSRSRLHYRARTGILHRANTRREKSRDANHAIEAQPDCGVCQCARRNRSPAAFPPPSARPRDNNKAGPDDPNVAHPLKVQRRYGSSSR
jgi:hypothetical protein